MPQRSWISTDWEMKKAFKNSNINFIHI
jgi:hypothetical protein